MVGEGIGSFEFRRNDPLARLINITPEGDFARFHRCRSQSLREWPSIIELERNDYLSIFVDETVFVILEDES